MKPLVACWVVLGVGCIPMPRRNVSDGGACEVGQSRACECGASSGVESCIAAEGVWSSCGCPRAGGSQVAVAPVPPVVKVCGAVTCAPYPQEDTEVGAKACCTSENACGSSSKFLFGDACLARRGDPGVPSPVCPSESVNFLDMEGCCRADGQCGLTIDAVNNFDTGCIERTRAAKLLNDGAGQRNTLSLASLLPIEQASFPAIRCR